MYWSLNLIGHTTHKHTPAQTQEQQQSADKGSYCLKGSDMQRLFEIRRSEFLITDVGGLMHWQESTLGPR